MSSRKTGSPGSVYTLLVLTGVLASAAAARGPRGGQMQVSADAG
jgi:hypothetical protein